MQGKPYTSAASLQLSPGAAMALAHIRRLHQGLTNSMCVCAKYVYIYTCAAYGTSVRLTHAYTFYGDALQVRRACATSVPQVRCEFAAKTPLNALQMRSQ